MATRVIFHLDMDAFFAAVEQRDRPALRGKPVIVGSPPNRRGVVCAASYEARKFGVRSAMPSSTAGRLCPKGIFIPPRIDQYQAESEEIMKILAATGAAIEPMSIDEAYLELTERFSEELSSSPEGAWQKAVALGKQLKATIFKERGLTASVGVASNKFLAKLASDYQKPNGLTYIPDRDKVLFLRSMPVRVIYGVGRVTEEALHKVGLFTVGDLQDYPGDFRSLVGSFGPELKRFAFGEDDRPLVLNEEIKSISAEETFDRDTDDRPRLRSCLFSQAEEIAGKLKRNGFGAHTVQVKVRYSDFTTLTRQVTVEEPLQQGREIYRIGCYLLRRDRLVCRPLRLLGLGVSAFSERGPEQLLLF